MRRDYNLSTGFALHMGKRSRFCHHRQCDQRSRKHFPPFFTMKILLRCISYFVALLACISTDARADEKSPLEGRIDGPYSANSQGSLPASSSDIRVSADGAPVIVVQPVDFEAGNLQSARFSISATGLGLTYRWQLRAAEGFAWYDIGAPEGTSASLSFFVFSFDHGTSFRCVVSNAHGIDVSATVVLRVGSHPLAPSWMSSSAGSITAPPNASVFLHTSVSGIINFPPSTPVIYGWQYLAPGGAAWVVLENTTLPYSGSTTDTLQVIVSEEMHGARFRCVISNNFGSRLVPSSRISIAGAIRPIISQHPIDAIVGSTQIARFEAQVDGLGPFGLQWNRSVDRGASWQTVSGANSLILEIPAASVSDNGQLYRLTATNASGSVNSSAARLLVVSTVSPTNDEFSNAAAIFGSRVDLTASNVRASREPLEPPHGAFGEEGAASVWWRWIAPVQARVTISTYGSEFDTTLAVYSGNALSNLQTIASNDNYGPLITSQLEFDAIAGRAYWIAIGGRSGATGSIVMRLNAEAYISPTITVGPANLSRLEGESAVLTVTAAGTQPLGHQWFKNGRAIPTATASQLQLSNLTESDAGLYSVVVTNAAGSATSAEARLIVKKPVIVTSRITNFSIRAPVSIGQILTVGASARGGPVPVLVRAVGPGLAPFGVQGTMTDPKLALFRNGLSIDSNDNWGGGPVLAAAFASVGAFGLQPQSLDAALKSSIEGGATIQVTGTESGIVLVEAYDGGNGGEARLINVSARGQVGAGAGVLVVGFSLSGPGTRTVLIRAVGPTLSQFGLTGLLADPKLILFAGTTQLAENDSWDPNLSPTFASVGAFALPALSKDAALVQNLPAGGYTAHLTGGNGGTGEALIEIYEVGP